MMKCAECKGKGMCGLPRCPVVSRFHAQVAIRPSSTYQGSSPSVFIGNFGYPDVQGGPLLVNDSDNPPDWLARNLRLEDIVNIRARTIRGRSSLHLVAGNLQEIALSSQPLDVEVAFEKPVASSLNFDGTIAPVGFTGLVKTLDIAGNARVERVVDRITSDTDLGATEACVALKESAIDVYRISGNRIVCILLPGDWKYEMIEIWGRHSLWGGENNVIVQDREIKKKGYSPISGVYYSARLAACEYLSQTKRSARNYPAECFG